MRYEYAHFCQYFNCTGPQIDLTFDNLGFEFDEFNMIYENSDSDDEIRNLLQSDNENFDDEDEREDEMSEHEDESEDSGSVANADNGDKNHSAEWIKDYKMLIIFYYKIWNKM